MQPYTQTTEYTTATSGLLMIINHFKPEFELTRENEFLIWRRSTLLPTRASSIFGLAAYAKEQGLSPKVVVESSEYDYPDYRFKRYKKSDIEYAAFMSDLLRKRAERLGVKVEERDISFEEVAMLVKENVILIRLNEGVFRDIGSTSKYVVLYGKEGDKFLIGDPIQEESLLKVSEEQLRESFETLTTKKKRDHRMIVF